MCLPVTGVLLIASCGVGVITFYLTFSQMASYTYDPALGEAVESGQINDQTQDQALDIQDSLDLAQQKSFDNASRNLANRAINKSQGVADDEQPGLGVLKSEMRLQEIQNELAKTTDPTRSALLQFEAEQLASLLVGATTQEDPQQGLEEPSAGAEAASELVAQYGQEAVTETLAWAGENLDRSSNEALNDVLDSDEATYGYEVVNTLKQNPDLIGTGDHVDFTQLEADELINEYGEAGETLVTLNAMIGTNKISRGEALKMAMKDPATLQAAFDAAKRNLITWSI